MMKMYFLIIPFLAVLLSVSYVSAIDDFDGDADFLFKEGVKSYQEGNFELAITYFDRVLEIDTNHVGALNNKGSILSQQGRHEDAISYFDKVLEINPEQAGALNNKGLALNQQGKLKQAISYFDKVLEQDPENINALNNKGGTLFQLNNLEEAEIYLDKVLEIDPNKASALTNKGAILVHNGEIDNAITIFDKILELNPNHVGALKNKAIALTQQDKFYEATSYFYRALQLDPSNEFLNEAIKHAKNGVGYLEADGYTEIIIRNSQGQLIGYLKDTIFQILNHELATNYISDWPIEKQIVRNEQNYEVLKKIETKVTHSDSVMGRYGTFDDVNPEILLILTTHWGYKFNEGDEITFIETIFRPQD